MFAQTFRRFPCNSTENPQRRQGVLSGLFATIEWSDPYARMDHIRIWWVWLPVFTCAAIRKRDVNDDLAWRWEEHVICNAPGCCASWEETNNKNDHRARRRRKKEHHARAAWCACAQARVFQCMLAKVRARSCLQAKRGTRAYRVSYTPTIPIKPCTQATTQTSKY